MKKSSVGLAFVKKHLPKHLYPYAHLLTYVVNNRIGWLLLEDRQLALLLSMAVLDKAWQKWQETPGDYTEAQFCAYLKKKVDGMILTEYGPHIRGRQAQQEAYREEIEAQREEQEEIAGTHPNPVSSLKSDYDKDVASSLSHLLRFDKQETQEAFEDELLIVDGYEANALVDDDGDPGYAPRTRANLSAHDKLMLLLPERERYMVRFGDGGRIAKISKTWGISRVRGQQIHKAGLERLNKAIQRLQAGEKFENLLKESKEAQAIALKKDMAGKDIEHEKEFQEFCDERSLDKLTIYSRNFFGAYASWLNEDEATEAEYLSFCKEEEYDPDSDEAFAEYEDHLYTIHYYQPMYGKTMEKYIA